MLKKISMIAAVVIALQSGPISASTLSDDAGQAFQDNRLDWLMHPDMLQSLTQGSKGDPDALRFIADLFAKGDERAVTALQNYMDRFPRDAAAFHIAGTDLLRKGDYEVAVIAFEKALVLDPTADWAVSKMGVAQILNDDVDAGVRTLKRAIKFQPDNPLTLRYLSWAAMRQGDVAEAIMHSERALKAFGLPGDRVNQAHLDLATLYRQTGQYGKVSELLRAAVDSAQLDVSDNTALQVYGMYFEAQLARGNAAEARRAIEKFRPMVDASHPEVLLSEARLMTLEGRQNEAVEVLEAAMQDTRIEGDLLVPDLAKTLASADRLQDALAEIDAAMSHDARPDASLALLRVQLLSDAARETEAIAYLEGLLTDGEDRPDLELMLAEVHLRNGDFAIAEEKAVQAAVRLPQDTQALYTAALAATAQDDDVQAEAYLRQAIDVNPEETRLWLTLLGVVHGHDTYAGHESAEEHAQVEALLNEAIEINPGNVELRYELGLLKLSDGRVEEAIEAFDGALERVPSHTPSLTLGALARADIGQDLETARRMVTLTSFMVPENGVLQDILGWVEHAEGNSAQAVETLTNALVMEPDDVTIRYHLAAALEAVGELESAGEYYISALRGDMYAHYSSGAREALARLGDPEVVEVVVHRIDETGIQEELGTVTLQQTEDGVSFTPELVSLPAGVNAVHVHVYPDCGPSDGPEGPVVGGRAGAHFGHDEHAHHMAAMAKSGETGGMAEAMAGMTAEEHAAHMQAMAKSEESGGMAEAMAGMTAEEHAAHMQAMAKSEETGGMAEAMAGMTAEEHAAHMAAMASSQQDDGGGMEMELPRGDLAGFETAENGSATQMIESDRLSLSEIRGRTLMIHEGPDVMGMSGPKIACAIIR